MSDDPDGDQDVKRWLRGALADEPPLRLDRDQVFRDGKRKLRNRKLFQAGGAVTGVVAVVVGAMLVTGLVTTEEPELPPAATSTAERPPVSTTHSRPQPPSSAPVTPPSADGNAIRLTNVLAGLLPGKLEPLPGESGKPMFQKLRKKMYRIDADLQAGTAEGWVSVLVEQTADAQRLGTTCSIPDIEFYTCSVRVNLDVPMTVAVQKLADGEVRRYVRAVRPDGAVVTAVASNVLEADRGDGKVSSYDREPPLSEQQLMAIAAHPDLALY